MLAHELAHTVQQGGVGRKVQREKEPAEIDHLPRPLPDKVGTLDYYRARHNDFVRRYGDTLTPPDYYLSYGDKYARKFTLMTRLLMSDKGKAWIDKTFYLLQDKIEKELNQGPVDFDRMERNGDALRKFAFRTHPDAYIEGGLVNLEWSDIDAIYWTIDGEDFWTLETLKQAIITAAKGSPEFAKRISEGMERDASETKYEIMRWMDWETIYNITTFP